jgi:glutamate/tyrosine decarboxylase-like PLP-dependent enzyme
MIVQDKAEGQVPFCVIAQVGSINIGAIDPLDAVADICAKHGLWFHADGACGAIGRLLDEKAPQYRGLERADSVTLDPHKWLFIPYDCGCVLVRHPEKLRRAFSMSAPYLRGTLPSESTGLDYFEQGPEMSRGFRALKVWMTLKHYGVDGYRRLLAQGVRCAERLDELVRASADFEALHEPNLFIYSFRYVGNAAKRLQTAGNGPGTDSQALNAYLDWLNQRIADEIQASGLAFIMTSTVHGHTVLRLSICSHRTTLEDIEAVFNQLSLIGAELDQGAPEDLYYKSNLMVTNAQSKSRPHHPSPKQG